MDAKQVDAKGERLSPVNSAEKAEKQGMSNRFIHQFIETALIASSTLLGLQTLANHATINSCYQPYSTLLHHDPNSKPSLADKKSAGRQQRREVRKAKRQEKAESKKARKSNVKRAAKWAGKRKEQDLEQKGGEEDQPAKSERSHRRLLERAGHLEEQAERLMAEARKARARYEVLEAQRRKGEQQQEEDQEDAPGVDDGSGSGLSSGSNSDSASSPAGGDDGKIEQGNDEEDVPMADANGKDDSDDSSVEEPPKKSKKSKKKTETIEPEPEDEAQPAEKGAKEEKKEKKKSKKSSKVKSEAEDSAPETEKSSKKDKKRKREADVPEPTAEAEAELEKSSKKKSNKDKNSKSDKVEEKAPATGDRAPPAVADAEQWHVSGLGGGADRQAKFLRLLGGKKAGAAAAGKGSVPSSRPQIDINKATSELEQQFEAGRRMKWEMGGQHKGLGA